MPVVINGTKQLSDHKATIHPPPPRRNTTMTSSAIKLVKLIKAEEWEKVMNHVSLHPKDATIPSSLHYKSETPSGDVLPLHKALSRSPPADVVLALIFAEPKTIMVLDYLGRLPLHFASRFRASFDVMKLMIDFFPQATSVACDKGATPLMLYCLCGDSVETLKLLISASPGGISKEDNCCESAIHYASRNRSGFRFRFITVLRESGSSNYLNHSNEVAEGHSRLTALSLTTGEIKVHLGQSIQSARPPQIQIEDNNPRPKRRLSTKTCVICMANPASMVLVPCGHACLCGDCGTGASLLKLDSKCPECRGEFSCAIRVYGRIVNDE